MNRADSSSGGYSAPMPWARLPKGRLRANLTASCLEGAAYGGMVGFGETYLAAFVLAIGSGELMAGMVGSLPLVAGGVMQLVSPAAVRALGSHKWWVTLCAAVQALTFVPLFFAAMWGSISGLAVLLVATVYWGAGLATGPAWNTWIGTMTPRNIRPRYFAIRTRGSHAAVCFGFLAGGMILQRAGDRYEPLMTAYALLFAAAGVCRLASVGLLVYQNEPTPIPPNMRQIHWREVIAHLRGQSGGRLLVYLVAVQAAVQMAGPYFTPFMLEQLRLSYAKYAVLIMTAFLAKVISLPVWGRVAHRIGAWRLLWIGGIGIIPMSAAWLVSGAVAWLMFVQAAAGVAWAAYELAFFLLFFESIPEQERTSLLTLYNLINTGAFVAGALAGGAILYYTGASHAGYMVIFGVSSVGRCFSLLLLARIPEMEVEAAQIGVRTVAVRPNSASIDAPVLPSMPDQTGAIDALTQPVE